MNRMFARVGIITLCTALLGTQTTEATFTCWKIGLAVQSRDTADESFWEEILQKHVAAPKKAKQKKKSGAITNKGLKKKVFEKKTKCEIFGCSHEKRVETLSCCGKGICKKCLKETYKKGTMVVDQNPKFTDVFEHPTALVYSDKQSPEQKAEIERYELATPKSEPEWNWRKFNGHWYFREQDKESAHRDRYWRYAHEESRNSAVHWEHVVAPMCPFCRREFFTPPI